MGLLSIFKRRADSSSNAAAAVSEPADAVQRARTRARQRLIGAAVLVVIGIIGFPLVFETQPRPIPVDIPIEVPRKDGAPPLVMPAARAPVGAAPAAPAVQATPPAATPNDVITESREEAGREVAASAPAAAQRVQAKPAASAAVEPAPAKPMPAPKPTVPSADASRAKALLEGKPPAPEEAARFVVQVGAFADPGAAREARLKVEKLGLKTYMQVASTPAGERIRVRVGPFGSREDAEKAMAKAKAAGLAAVVLTL
jgi:DedD protein